MTMAPAVRKFGLTVHVMSSVGWLGAIVAYVVLNAAALTSQDARTVRAAYLMMEPVARYAIVPLALASLVTGIVQSLGTSWGLFRHYWVLVSLVVTVVAVVVLLLHMRDVRRMAEVAADPAADLGGLGGDLVHSVGGLLVLLAPLVLNIYKPRGVTRYGRRKQREQRSRTTGDATPR